VAAGARAAREVARGRTAGPLSIVLTIATWVKPAVGWPSRWSTCRRSRQPGLLQATCQFQASELIAALYLSGTDPDDARTR
jgi:hypothetical protein